MTTLANPTTTTSPAEALQAHVAAAWPCGRRYPVTFEWTEARWIGLCGFDGEDLPLAGVQADGNYVNVSLPVALYLLREVEDAEEISHTRAARDIDGTLWALA